MSEFGTVGVVKTLLPTDGSINAGATLTPGDAKSIEIFKASFICLRMKGIGAAGSNSKLTFNFLLKCGDDEGSDAVRNMAYPTVPTNIQEVNTAVGAFAGCAMIDVRGYTHIKLLSVVSASAGVTSGVNVEVNWKES